MSARARWATVKPFELDESRAVRVWPHVRNVGSPYKTDHQCRSSETAGRKLVRVAIAADRADAVEKVETIFAGTPSLRWDSSFDQALLKVDPNLKYSELIDVINVFSELKLNKISFSELGANDAG